MMKRFYILLIFTCINVFAAQQTNNAGVTVSTPEKWQNTIIGGLLINTDFVFINIESRDMLAIKLYPKNLLFNSEDMPSKTDDVKKNMKLIESIYANDIFLKADEEIKQTSFINKQNLNGVIYTSHFNGSEDLNYTWVGNTQNYMVLMKITTKSTTNTYNDSDIIDLVNSLKMTQPNKTLNNSKPSTQSIGYHFNQYSGISKLEKHTENEFYYDMNAVYVEEDAISAYVISSVCTDIDVPNSLINSVILKDLGIEDALINGNIEYHNQSLPIVIGQYSTSTNDKYHMISTIIKKDKCQHLLAYIVEKKIPLVDRFLKFIDHFHPNHIPVNKFKKNLATDYKNNYANTLLDLAYKFSQLKMYNKSNHLYRESYEINPTEDTLYSILSTFNKSYNYQKGIDYIATLNIKELSNDTIIWKAWFHSRLNDHKIAAKTFKQVFDDTFTTDEDFFQYIKQLKKIEKYQDIKDLINQYKTNVNDQQLIKITKAQLQTELNPEQAKSYILSLLSDENLIVNYQYDLLDALIKLDAYDEIITYSKDRIAKGFESAVLLNYLGDAYNAQGKVEIAYEYMHKAHQLAPKNKIIKSYYESLRNSVGKADLSVLDKNIKVVPIPDEIQEKIVKLKAQNPNESYEIIYDIVAYSHNKDQKNRKTIYNKRKINNKSGVAKNKTLNFSFDQEYENIYINKFHVLDKTNKIIAKFDVSKAYITTDDDGILADTDKLLNIPVPSLEVGVMIDYAITVESKYPSTVQPFTESFFVSSVSNQYKAIVYSGEIEKLSIDADPAINTHIVSDSIMYWDYLNTPNYKKTPLLPDLQEVFPVIKLSTADESWSQTGDIYLNMIEDKLNTKIDDDLLFSLTAESNNKLENAKKIISYVQDNISYQAIEFGMRAQIPNKSSTTIRNMYGDCKDHAVLLHDLLNASNIKADLALVNSGNDISQKIPTHNQFNHMIVYLPEINGGVFIDTTDKDSSLDFLNPPQGMQGYHALVLEKNHSKLIQIPESTPDNNTINIQRTVDKENNKYIYQETATITGSYASSFRNYLKSIEIDELESRILKWVNNYYSDLVLTEFKYHNLYENNQPLTLEFSFFQNSEYASIKLPIFIERYALEFTPSPKRHWDFELKDTFKITSITKVLNTNNLKIASINTEIDSHLMNWQIKSDEKSIEFNGIVYSNRLPASDYTKLIDQSKKSYKTIEKLLLDIPD